MPPWPSLAPLSVEASKKTFSINKRPHSSPSLSMSAIRVPLSEPRYSSTEPAHAQPQIVFTRQLWERTMPATDTNDTGTGSEGFSSVGGDQAVSRSRRPSSTVPIPPHPQPSPTLSRPSDTPLTPEESPPFRSSRKRSADTLEQDDHFTHSPSHTRDNSGDSPSFCLCQPEPKVPRPRNAFILYRQHHQTAVVAQHPGLANPDISKIIGEQWRNEPDEVKNRWKEYAEEEKLQHQQRYPTYRYQPKRSGRRASVSSDSGALPSSELRKCSKCGGRSINTPTTSAPASAKEKHDTTDPPSVYTQPLRNNSFQLPPPTPSTTTTPSTRYLPMLNSLSLSSPHARRMAQGRPLQSYAPMQRNDEERISPLTPDSKRRRFESPQGTYVMSTRTMGPRQNAGPGTQFPFAIQQQQPSQQHPSQHQHQQAGLQYSASSVPPHVRRESLPPAADILRGRSSNPADPTSMMGPPPRPGPGYFQHRQSQGHVRPSAGELSLTLPPLQTVGVPQGPATSRLGSGHTTSGTSETASAREPDRRTLAEKIMSIPFQHKIGILRRITPPLPQASKQKSRTTIIAVEGDDSNAAKSLTDWLAECLSRESDIIVKVVDGPKPSDACEGNELQVPDLFQTVIEWHAKNKELVSMIKGCNGTDTTSTTTTTTPTNPKDSDMNNTSDHTSPAEEPDISMSDLDTYSTAPSPTSRTVILFRTYTLTASNFYSSGIPIKDVYRPDDHWQWTATLWRGILGPDLTIYVRDVETPLSLSARDEGAKGGVEIVEEHKTSSKFMAIRRARGGERGERGDRGGLEGVEAGTLRRLGFEVGEWVRSATAGKVDA